MFNKCAVFCGVMVRVLDLRPGHSGFESRSVLTLILCCFLKDKFYFYFKQDLDLEPVKVNSTTSRGMCREHKDNFFIFINLWYSPWHFD